MGAQARETGAGVVASPGSLAIGIGMVPAAWRLGPMMTLASQPGGVPAMADFPPVVMVSPATVIPLAGTLVPQCVAGRLLPVVSSKLPVLARECPPLVGL